MRRSFVRPQARGAMKLLLTAHIVQVDRKAFRSRRFLVFDFVHLFFFSCESLTVRTADNAALCFAASEVSTFSQSKKWDRSWHLPNCIRYTQRNQALRNRGQKMLHQPAPNPGTRLWTGCTPLKTSKLQAQVFR
jgi:hypothetical protein